MGKDRVAQHRIRHVTDHRGLRRDHQFACFESHRGKAENLVAVLRDQHLHEAARFGYGSGAQHFGYRHLRQPIFDSVAMSLGLVSSDARQFRIGEHAEWHQPIFRASIAAVQVFVNDAEVVKCDVREHWAARAISHRPDIRGRGLQPVVDLDIAVLVELDAGQIETDSIRVRRPARRDQNVGTFDRAFVISAMDVDADLIAGMSIHLANFGPEQHFDSFADEKITQRGANVGIFVAGELLARFDHGHLRAKPPKRLRQFKTDVPIDPTK